MRTEVVAIGNELLSGYVLNTNIQLIAKALLMEGYTIEQGTLVQDSVEEITLVLKDALKRSTLIIVTGGLGPTIDDKTREAICLLFNTTMAHSPALEEALIKKFGSFSPSIHNQAIQPKGAEIILNQVGSAPALIFKEGEKCIIFLPGPPVEMSALLREIVPKIKNFEKASTHIRWLYLTHLKESEVDPKLRELKEKYPFLEYGIYPAPALVTVSIKGNRKEDVEQALQELKSEFFKELLDLHHGSLSLTCKNLFLQKGLTLSIAESLSGGRLGAFLTTTPGASDYFLGSIIPYSNAMKMKVLGVEETLLQEKGAVSREVAILMAENVRNLTGSSIGVSVTGIAGPLGGSLTKPLGTYFACIVEKDKVHSWEGKAPGTRETVMEWVVNDILSSLCRIVREY